MVYFSAADTTKVLLISQNNGASRHTKQAAGTLLESPALFLKRKDLPTLIFVCREKSAVLSDQAALYFTADFRK